MRLNYSDITFGGSRRAIARKSRETPSRDREISYAYASKLGKKAGNLAREIYSRFLRDETVS